MPFVVFIPCVLLSAVISSITVEMNIKKSKTQGIVASCFSAGLSIIAYTLAIKNQKGIQYIIENSRQMVENPNLTIGNIEISNSLSSYFFIFIIIVVCTMIFNALYSLLKEVNFTGYTQHLMK